MHAADRDHILCRCGQDLGPGVPTYDPVWHLVYLWRYRCAACQSEGITMMRPSAMGSRVDWLRGLGQMPLITAKDTIQRLADEGVMWDVTARHLLEGEVPAQPAGRRAISLGGVR